MTPDPSFPEDMREWAEAIAREYDDPPKCRVCGRDLEFGSSEDGGIWRCFQENRGVRGYDRAEMEHTDRSTMRAPPLKKRIATLARWALERDAEAKRLEDEKKVLVLDLRSCIDENYNLAHRAEVELESRETELQNLLDGYWRRIQDAEAKLAAGRAEAEAYMDHGGDGCSVRFAAEAIRRAME